MRVVDHSFKSETENSVSSAEKSEFNSRNVKMGAYNSSQDAKKPRTAEGTYRAAERNK
jgi:hypothetical protein